MVPSDRAGDASLNSRTAYIESTLILANKLKLAKNGHPKRAKNSANKSPNENTGGAIKLGYSASPISLPFSEAKLD